MKNLQSYDQFIGESSVNEAYSFDKIAIDYQNNPYGIGASRVQIVGGDSNYEKGHRILQFNCEDAAQREKVMKKLKDLGAPAKKMTKTMQDKGYMYRYQVNLFESEIVNIDEAAKWPLTDKINSSTFYNMWASLDVASTNLSDYMDEANRGKDADALFSLKVAYDELTSLMKSKTIEKEIKAMEAELREKNVIK
jgi:hypothetical protein